MNPQQTSATAPRQRIMVICGDDAPSIAVANVYATMLKDHDLCFVEEQVLSFARFRTFSRRRLREQGVLSLLGVYLYYLLKLFLECKKENKAYTPCIKTKNVSQDKLAAAMVASFAPDIVIVGFCGLLSADFLQLLPARVYNTHPGINPRYRGFGNIWAFAGNDIDCTGFTIHEVDAGADTGKVLLSSPVNFKGIPFSQIDIHAGRVAAGQLALYLCGHSLPETPPRFLHLSSSFYRMPTLGTWLRARRQYMATTFRSHAPASQGALHHVLITGASSGIGASLAKEFAQRGTTLTLWARDTERLATIARACEAKGASVQTVSRDYRQFSECRQALADIDEHHPVTLLILNAGISTGTLPDGTPESPEDVCRSVEVNVTGTVNLASFMLERMRKRSSGHVVFLSSIAALYPLPDSPIYGAGKAALAYYAKAMRGVCSGSEVKITTIYPGYVDSPMSRRLKGPQPLRWDTEKAAVFIRNQLKKGATTIVFPKLLALGTLLLHCLPFPVALLFLRHFGFRIQPDYESIHDTTRPHGVSQKQ